MRQIINEISKGKNIDDNLKKYADGFSKINNKFVINIENENNKLLDLWQMVK